MTDPVDTDALRSMARSAGLWEPDTELVDAAADDLDRLRAVIENAPHDEGCHPWNRDDGSTGATCICWKADAL